MLLLAAGRGTRFGGPLAKAYLQLGGKPLLVIAAERLARVADPNHGNPLVLVVHPDDREHLEPWLPDLRRLGDVRVTPGGSTRQESMTRGLEAAGEAVDLVLVHDAARALLPIDATRSCLAAAQRTGAALLAVPVADTLKRAADGVVVTTV
ncbi:MAG: 2-C-methyl-D-erythritol 4-phosphate cytidylyltransferase, partial [Planctomycetes bacterium]|nr:2-C-methyl-D-erythritol 4-phosphate cytidylyltransferase [Planctomycetota bacterium]